MDDTSPAGRSLTQLTSALARMVRLSHFTIEASTDLIIWLSDEGYVTRVNRAACVALCREPAAFRGCTFAELLVEPERPAWEVHFARVVREPVDNTFEGTMIGLDGAPFAVEVVLDRVEVDASVYHCAFVRGIAERKRSEAALKEALNELQQMRDRLRAENSYLQREIQLDHNFEEIVGRSEALREVLARVARVASSDATVLILGESGTGKELLARAVHHGSPRRERPLVKVNCAALPASLIESELFGHEKGAFTHAISRRLGRFELAHGGTLFLDEVGELPLELQPKLLRVLQEGEFERLGSTQTQRVDVRVIAATNQNLADSVAKQKFRADLFYRLNVFPVRAPALRERADDVPLLAGHFLRKFGGRMGKSISGLSVAMLDSLVRYAWPGNVRELENIIERAVILHQGSGPLDQSVVPDAAAARPAAPIRTLREMEIELITAALDACNGVVGGKHGAARRLDIPASTLRERILRYGIVRR